MTVSEKEAERHETESHKANVMFPPSRPAIMQSDDGDLILLRELISKFGNWYDIEAFNRLVVANPKVSLLEELEEQALSHFKNGFPNAEAYQLAVRDMRAKYLPVLP